MPRRTASLRRSVKTVPLSNRKNKVSLRMFGRPFRRGGSFHRFIDSLPDILAARSFKECVAAIIAARSKGKPVIAAMGGHVVKCGVSPVIIDLMERGVITAIAMNGSTAIHDFEIALIGATSEDVQRGLEDGTFGMAAETGEMMNEALASGVENGIGAGKAIGGYINERRLPHRKSSLLARAEALDIPATVHIAIGTDIIHQHPQADGAITGKATMDDFDALTGTVSRLGGGGVFLNIGSAVIMPEVFLKALTVARNRGRRIRGFTTAVFDMLPQYRASQNVAIRPVSSGGKGYYFIGHHEIMIPMLAAAVIEGL